MKLGIVTIAHGRHEHLARQLSWVASLRPRPHIHVVVSMGDPDIAGIVAPAPGTLLVSIAGGPELPLAAARNHGVAVAAEEGATAVALLDVDCLPEPGLVADYLDALGSARGTSVVTGRVRYLPPGLSASEHTLARLTQAAEDHPLRTVPTGDQLIPADVNLLWSLNIAATIRDWQRIGGFDERYVGYGAEDTDFGRRLQAAGGTLWWARGAGVFHQWHPTSSPPVQHAAAIARNANLFRSIWGEDPMPGWLEALEQSGHLRATARGWVATKG